MRVTIRVWRRALIILSIRVWFILDDSWIATYSSPPLGGIW